MFHMLATRGATAAIFQPSVHIFKLPLKALQLLLVTATSI
jgi:hypothetical protein